MPNRIIKESICTSSEIDSLTADEERFFYRLMVSCDDFGRLDAREQIVRAKCFPLKVDSVKNKDVKKWIDKLANVGLIVLYRVGDKEYLHFKTWEKHQQRRAKFSKYPSPDEGVISSDIICNHLQEHVTEESRNREYEESRNEDTRTEDVERVFNRLWLLYPKKKGKGQVSDTQKRKLYKIGEGKLTVCINRYKKDTQGKDIQYMQNGSTFFNSGYIDYLDENYQETKQDTGGFDENGKYASIYNS